VKKLPAIATLSLIAFVASPALGQSSNERLDNLTNILTGSVSNTRETYVDSRTTVQQTRATPEQLMRQTLSQVSLDEVPGRMALDIWAQQTNVPLVINWASLEAQGVDPDSPVTLNLRNIPADQALQLIVRQIHPDPIRDDALMIETQQWYVTVTTRHDALRRSNTRMYFVGDLLMDIPNFDNAPDFDLNQVLSNTNSGGSNSGGGGGGGRGAGGGGGGGPFGSNDTQQADRGPTQQDRIDNLLEMIRTTIEPDIWIENGGEYASVRYYRGMLIVNAPNFVHEQIGFTSVTTQSTARSSSGTSRSSSNAEPSTTRQSRQRSTSGNVAGVAPHGPSMAR